MVSEIWEHCLKFVKTLKSIADRDRTATVGQAVVNEEIPLSVPTSTPDERNLT